MSSLSDDQLNALSAKELESLWERVNVRRVRLRAEATAKATAQARELVASFGLTEREVFGRGRYSGASTGNSLRGTRLAPKYRDPQSGATWTGRGRAPRWLDGKNRDEFLIDIKSTAAQTV